MKISTNIVATMMVGNLSKANKKASTAMERLSSGLKINSVGDDPAGLAIANKLNAQVKGLSQAKQNVMNDIALVQTAEGALNEVHDMLNRIKELCVQGKNDTLGKEDRDKIQEEIDSLVEEIKRTGEVTQYNSMTVLESNDDIKFQIGSNSGQSLSLDGNEINLNQVNDIIDGIKIEDIDIISKVDEAVQMTSKIRGKLGAIQNRLEHTSTNLAVSEENMVSSLSRIQDADMAEEMANYTNSNVISQAGISMLAQANQRPQQVLQLLNS